MISIAVVHIVTAAFLPAVFGVFAHGAFIAFGGSLADWVFRCRSRGRHRSRLQLDFACQFSCHAYSNLRANDILAAEGVSSTLPPLNTLPSAQIMSKHLLPKPVGRVPRARHKQNRQVPQTGRARAANNLQRR